MEIKIELTKIRTLKEKYLWRDGRGEHGVMRQKRKEAGTGMIMAFKAVSPPVEGSTYVWIVVITVSWTGTGEPAAVHYLTTWGRFCQDELFITQQDLRHLYFDSYHIETKEEEKFSESNRTLICCILILKKK